MNKLYIFIASFIACFLMFIPGVMGESQKLNLQAGWNLISYPVYPKDHSVKSVFNKLMNDDNFAVWTYDANSKSWINYPSPLNAIPEIDHIVPHKGYWVKTSKTIALEINSDHTENIEHSILNFVSGWNFVGFITDRPIRYDSVFFNKPVKEIWIFDPISQMFKGIELSGTKGDPPLVEEFSQIEPGVGYWVKADNPFDLEPILGTAAQGDIDMPPLLESDDIPGERLVWNDITPGDDDIGNDGFYDPPETQRSITFRDSMTSHNISVFNSGSGILLWHASIDEPDKNSWLRFEILDDEEAKEILVKTLCGSLTTDTSILKLCVDRSGLMPGDYFATLTIIGNGDIRKFNVSMSVAPIDGDYQLTTKIETINGKSADIHNPKIFLSLYNQSGLKGIIDHEKTLLMSKRFYMTGDYYQDKTNQFIVSGSLELASNHDDNPYSIAIQKDITLIGDRSSKDDVLLGPLDIKGEYRETLRNVLKEPIYIKGTFTGIHLGNTPTAIENKHYEDKTSGDIPDTGKLEKIITIQDNRIITDISVTLSLSHTRPKDLIIYIISPNKTKVVLRKNSTNILNSVMTFDADEISIDGMESFRDEMSKGEWILCIEDNENGEIGQFDSWSLDIKGTPVYSIKGKVENVGRGAKVVLTGCGISIDTTTDSNGNYSFDNLINCNYKITISKPGYISLVKEISVYDSEPTTETLVMEKKASKRADFHISPPTGNAPLTIELTDISPSTVFSPDLQYKYVWYINTISSDGIPMHYLSQKGGSEVSFTIDRPGTYAARMEIHPVSVSSQNIIIVDKSDQPIVIGPFGNSNYNLSFLTTASCAGSFTQESAFDSATFDIDRPPENINNPGREDTNAFLGQENQKTNTNTPGQNNKIDGPVGDELKHYHLMISIGQPVMGISHSGDKVLSIGVNY